MRINNGVKAALVAASAGLLLTACGSDSTTEATDESTAPAATETSVADSINTTLGCEMFGGTWAAGEAAEGSTATEVYTCDEDGDGTVESTLFVYASADDRDADVATVEAAADDTAIAQGDDYLVATTGAANLATLVQNGATTVRELPVVE